VDSEVTGDPSTKLDLAQFNTKYLKINVMPTNIIGELYKYSGEYSGGI
jgi:hypothetical protein